jgi:hypothetical protein
MICRDIYIEQYDWEVHCYFAVNKYYTERILSVLSALGCSDSIFYQVEKKLARNEKNAGFTYSNPDKQESLLVVGLATSNEEYVNSISHELRHLCDDIASVYDIPSKGEEVAYLTGDIAGKLADIIQVLVCNCLDCLEQRYKKIRYYG